MSTFLFSAIVSGSVIDFDPDRDVLSFDVPGISAADLTLTPLPDGSGVAVVTLNSTFTLADTELPALGSTNVVFSDGSLLVNACATNSTAVWTGGAYDDLLMVAPGLPLTLGSLSSDGTPAEDSHTASLSGDGRYLFFTSLDGNVTATPEGLLEDDDVFMKDLLTGSVSRISIGPAATTDTYADSRNAAVSADASHVAFESNALNLVPSDTNGVADIFVKDLQTGLISRVSTTSSGAQATGGASSGASMSADGRLVAFTSAATNLVAGDTNGAKDIFVKDLQTGAITRVSTSSSGAQGDGGQFRYGSRDAHLSADGKFVLFISDSTNLVAGDTNRSTDVFVKNLATGAVVAVSTNAAGAFVEGFTAGASISADGQVVAFTSSGALLNDGLDGTGSIYVRDMVSGTLTRVTGASAGTDAYNLTPVLSGDGRFVVFATDGPLTVGDNNEASGIFVKDLQTGQIAQLLQSASGWINRSPTISADGSTISFVSDGNLLTGVAAGTHVYAITNPLDTSVLAGGAGDDKYVIAHTLEQIVENTAEGNDTVVSSVSYTLPDNVENLVLSGAGTSSATGNALANTLTGNAAANTLDGGAGNDTLSGGAGNDTYMVDSSLDVVLEITGGGVDTVVSTVTLTLAAGTENLTLAGSADINGTGTAVANVMQGNAGNNKLYGGLGTDTASYANATASVTVSLALSTAQNTGSAGSDLLANFENLTGSHYADNLTGSDLANLIDGGGGADTMAGGLGDDTYVVNDGADQTVESLSAGTDTVQSAVTWTLAANTENLTLTGTASLINATGNELANFLRGNSGSNLLTGGSGNDTLDGGAGSDNLKGGSGDDTYMVDGTEWVTELANQGLDTVQSSVSYTLPEFVENLTLTGSAANNAIGNMLNNLLLGNAGNNVLVGGGGTDTLRGGAGDDTYAVDNIADDIAELAGGGTDTVTSAISWTLAAEFENLTLAYLSTPATDGTGNAANNRITGNTFDNRLDGGLGADTMAGGEGNDTYIVDNLADSVSELLNEDLDTVLSSVTWTLGLGQDNLTLTGSAASSGYGSDWNNQLVGNTAGNVLDGGAGADSLTGGAGNDTYVIDDVGDRTTELAHGGVDTVKSSISWTLGAELENLLLTGLTASNGTGNALANQLTGNSYDNMLDGGLGADTLTGGAGNDSYVIDNSSDRIVEAVGGGVDLALSSITWTMAGEVENLQLTGTAAVNGTGNTLANSMVGNVAANVLNGGAGADTLTGGAGSDTFYGGSGDDMFIVENLGDKIVELAGGGIDLVQSSLTWTLSSELENLTLTGSAAFDGYGNGLNNKIVGNGNLNVLNGGAGADSMAGGNSDDTYVVDNIGDQTNELQYEGRDVVQSSISWSLGANMEDLVLTGIGAINGTGNELSNQITGNAADNVLSGGSGGPDKLIGGAGNDTYVLNDHPANVVELAGEGIDTIVSSSNHTYLSYELENVENITLIGQAYSAEGNDLDNVLTGTAAANYLNGGGGADMLIGGEGDDMYRVETPGDSTVELSGGGVDTVLAYTSWTLASNVENLVLDIIGINGTGNSLDNKISVGDFGGYGVLDGGLGADTLQGSWGSQTYVVDNIRDVTIEGLPYDVGSTDLVKSSVTWTLSENIENLTLTGSSAISGTGNELANSMLGNAASNGLNGGAGADTLNGSAGADTLNGGLGADTLYGGADSDTYIVDNIGDRTVEAVAGGTDLVQSSITWTLASEVENLALTGSTAINATGNTQANTLTGNAAANVLTGALGADRLTGGAGTDTFVLDSLLSSDTITDFASGSDKLRISQAGIRVGDGDTLVEGAKVVAGPNGFAASAEWTIVTHDIVGALTAASAAAAIGSATSAYTVGQTALFTVDNGSDSALYLFKATDANALVSATELTLLATLSGNTTTGVGDVIFAV